MKVLFSLLFALNFFAIESYFITELFTVDQIDRICVAKHLNIELNITGNDEDVDKKICNREIEGFKKSIPQTIKGILSDKPEINAEVEKCAINLLEFYNITSIVFKALAYHQKLLDFTTNSQKSCEDVVKFNSTLTDGDCGIKVLTVESIGVNKSFIHLKHCLNDLFHELKADKIAFDDSDGGEIFNRLFGKHLMEFIMQLSMMGVKYCEIDDKVVDDTDDVGIDIFGLTEPSKKVENCIMEEIKNKKDLTDENFTMTKKKMIKIVIACMKEF